MTVSGLELWVLIGVALTFMGGCAVVLPIRCRRSSFRYRLWRLRDAIVDDLLAAHVPDNDYVLDILDRVEKTIACAREITLAAMVITPPPPQEYLNQRSAARSKALAKLDESTRTRIKGYEKEHVAAMAGYLFRGSWFGIGVGLVWGIVELTKGIIAKRASAARAPVLYAKVHVVRRGQNMRDLNAFVDDELHRDSDRSLAACV